MDFADSIGIEESQLRVGDEYWQWRSVNRYGINA